MPTGVVEARYEEITHAEVAHVREGHRGTLRLTPVRGHAGSLPDRCRSHHISVSTPAVPHPTPIGPDGARVRGHYPPVVAPLVCKRSILQRECKRNDGPSANPGGGDRGRPPTREEGVPVSSPLWLGLGPRWRVRAFGGRFIPAHAGIHDARRSLFVTSASCCVRALAWQLRSEIHWLLSPVDPCR